MAPIPTFDGGMVDCQCGCNGQIPDGKLLTITYTTDYQYGTVYNHSIEMPGGSLAHWNVLVPPDFKTLDYLAKAWPVVAVASESYPYSIQKAADSAAKTMESLAKASQEIKNPFYKTHPPTENQEETNAKWRPWFDALTENEQITILTNCMSAFSYSNNGEDGDPTGFKEFPEVSDETWRCWEATLQQPGNWLKVLTTRIPALKTEYDAYKIKMPCGHPGSFANLHFRDNKTLVYLYSIVIHLNDNHSWSFTEIANWLDTLELDLTFQDPYDDTEDTSSTIKE